MVKVVDFLADAFEDMIREYDEQCEIAEKDYRRMARLFSAVVRTSPEIRALFFNKAKELSVEMKKNFDEITNSTMKQIEAVIKGKIYN
jgi:hypothetical protein